MDTTRADKWLRAHHQSFAAQDALALLRRALVQAKLAKAPRTTARIRAAISSAAGAVRNADYRKTRAQRGA